MYQDILLCLCIQRNSFVNKLSIKSWKKTYISLIIVKESQCIIEVFEQNLSECKKLKLLWNKKFREYPKSQWFIELYSCKIQHDVENLESFLWSKTLVTESQVHIALISQKK